MPPNEPTSSPLPGAVHGLIEIVRKLDALYFFHPGIRVREPHEVKMYKRGVRRQLAALDALEGAS